MTRRWSWLLLVGMLTALGCGGSPASPAPGHDSGALDAARDGAATADAGPDAADAAPAPDARTDAAVATDARADAPAATDAPATTDAPVATDARADAATATDSAAGADATADATPAAWDGGPAAAVVTLAAGGAHTCDLAAAGATKCWGSSTAGQLGAAAPETCTYLSTPCARTPITVSSLADAAQLAGGGTHTCAIVTGGAVRCWGSNAAGQLGLGTTTNHTIPVAVPGLAGIAQLGAGQYHTCALLGDGTARCWGLNSAGQLGGSTTGTCTVSGTARDCGTSPITVAGLAGARELALGSGHTCARLGDGTVACWGSNYYGQLGDGSAGTRSTPGLVPGLAAVVQLAAGALHTCALLADGTARCWGLNTLGGLGDGTTTERDAPTPVSGLTGAAQLAAGAYHTCARLADGTARCWGSNIDGILGATSSSHCIDGTGTSQPCALTPLTVTGLAGALHVTTGYYHTCALLAAGEVDCWGSTNEGQVGRGVVAYGWSATPMAVTGLP
ncbi:MAG TPA: hypothetical protein VGQ83_22840 [Polyangia bacterium]